jgi:hypothetical protein
MATRTQREQNEAIDRHERDTLHTLIEEQVMHTLGAPNDLHKVQVRRLWQHHYRVNIFTGLDAMSGRIANSYFVEVNGDGKIVATRPTITKLY